MSDEDNSGRISRRDVLKGTSAGAVGVSVTGAASAESEPDTDAMRTLRQSDRVTSILEELGRPTLDARSINESTVSTERGDLTGIGVQTPYGPLYYCENDSGETGALLHVETGASSGRRSARTDKYAAVPADTNAVLIGREDDAVFRREATDAEAAAVARVVGRDRLGDDSIVYTGSDVDGFNVDVFDEDAPDAGSTRPRRLVVRTPEGERRRRPRGHHADLLRGRQGSVRGLREPLHVVRVGARLLWQLLLHLCRVANRRRRHPLRVLREGQLRARLRRRLLVLHRLPAGERPPVAPSRRRASISSRRQVARWRSGAFS